MGKRIVKDSHVKNKGGECEWEHRVEYEKFQVSLQPFHIKFVDLENINGPALIISPPNPLRIL